MNWSTSTIYFNLIGIEIKEIIDQKLSYDDRYNYINSIQKEYNCMQKMAAYYHANYLFEKCDTIPEDEHQFIEMNLISSDEINIIPWTKRLAIKRYELVVLIWNNR
eukprot:58835_1